MFRTCSSRGVCRTGGAIWVGRTVHSSSSVLQRAPHAPSSSTSSASVTTTSSSPSPSQSTSDGSSLFPMLTKLKSKVRSAVGEGRPPSARRELYPTLSTSEPKPRPSASQPLERSAPKPSNKPALPRSTSPKNPAGSTASPPAEPPTPVSEVGWSALHQTAETTGDPQQVDQQPPKTGPRVIFQPGTIIEALKGQMRVLGVVLDTVILEERLRLRLLTPSGAILYPYPENVLFTFTTNSIPQPMVAATGTSDTEMDLSQTEARSKVVGILRTILTQSTELRTETDPIMEDAWDRFRYHGDSHDDARRRPLVTTAQVTRWVEDETKLRRNAAFTHAAKLGNKLDAATRRRTPVDLETAAVKELRLHRVYQSMMNKPEVFIAQEKAQWKTEIWRMRSAEDVHEMRTVDEWMKTSDPRIESFIEKAQVVIDHARPLLSAPLDSDLSSTPSLASPNVSLPTFDDSDRIIISHIQASFLNSRNQRSPFVSTVPTLLKKIDRYGGIVDVQATHLFLIEIGVRTPWDDIGTMFGLMELQDRAREDEGVKELFAELEAREKAAATSSSPSTPTTSSPSLSTYNSLDSDEFYPSDPLASIRHDFGDLPVYVIDDIEASELDDGVSVERSSREGHVWIHAHIADPTTLLHPSHRLSRLASQRASTSYLPQGNYPLLPAELSIERFSLGKNGKLSPGEGQECLTFSAEVNETTGEVGDYKIRASLIRNIQVTTYATVCAVLGSRRRETTYPLGPPRVRAPYKALAEPSEEWAPDLKMLLRASRAIAFRRLRDGGLNWSVPSYSIKVGPNPLPTLPLLPGSQPHIAAGQPNIDYAVHSPTLDPATEIVQTCMTLAGSLAGRFLAQRNLPGPYRAYPSPVGASPDSMARLLATRDPRTGDVSPFDIAKHGVVFLPGGMQTSPGAHWMMGLTAKDGGYVRVTSPLRRYADLLAHWQIKHALLAESVGVTGEAACLMGEEEMRRKGEANEAVEKLVQQTQRRSMQFWSAYALHLHARTFPPAPDPDGTTTSIPPPPEQIFPPLPSPPAGRLGPYRSICMSASFVDPSDPTRSSVMVLIPELGLQIAGTHPTGGNEKEKAAKGFEAGEECKVVLSGEWKGGVGGRGAGVEGVVFR